MMMISEAAVRRGELSATECQRIIGLLSVLGFKRDIGVQTGNIIREVIHDKKKSGNDLNIVMPCGIGKCIIERLSYDEFEQMFTTKG
jgi:3-dehydroquinate synthase